MKRSVIAYARRAKLRLITTLMVGAIALPTISPDVMAEPPPWAPAHGYRAKKYGHKHYHHGERHHHDDYDEFTRDLGILHGTCNREVIGAVLGGVVGGVVGSRVGEGDERKLVIVAGTVLGVLIGRHIGRSMDEADQQCTGQALEHAEDRRPIRWRNERTGTHFTVVPINSYEAGGRYCRDFVTEAIVSGQPEEVRGTACRTTEGQWQSVNKELL
jgi:surface antigen